MKVGEGRRRYRLLRFRHGRWFLLRLGQANACDAGLNLLSESLLTGFFVWIGGRYRQRLRFAQLAGKVFTCCLEGEGFFNSRCPVKVEYSRALSVCRVGQEVFVV